MYPHVMPSRSGLLKWIKFGKKRKGKYTCPPTIPCPYSITELELYLSVIQEKLRHLAYFRKSKNRECMNILDQNQEYVLEDSDDEQPWFIRPDMLFSVPIDTEQDILKARLMRDILTREKMISILIQKNT